jgi:hypothetical protein
MPGRYDAAGVMPESVAVPALTSFRDLLGVLAANGTLRSISRAIRQRGNEPPVVQECRFPPRHRVVDPHGYLDPA